MNFDCSATTESGGTLQFCYFDHRANHGKAHGTISIAVPGGDYHHEGPAADRFFERLWAVCRRDGLFEGSFSDFIVTSDEMKRMVPDRLNPRDARLQQEWASLVETPTKHPATQSPAEETHAEPEPRAASAEHRLDEVKELYATGEYAKARTWLEAVLKDEPGNERARSLLLRVVDRERREQEDDLRWQDLRRQAIKSVQPCRRPEGRDKAAREEDPMATPAMLSPAEETHAESAETAEPEPHAEPAERAE